MIQKKISSLILILVASLSIANAQDNAEVIKSKKNILAVNNQYKKPSRDFVMIQAGYTTWLLPSNFNINLKQRGLEFNGYICYDFPFQKSNFSFAAGIGIGSSSIYLDSMRVSLTDTSSEIRFKRDTLGSSKRFKLNTTYLEAPFEIRYFANKENRNKGFKAAAGVRVGTLINAHTKDIISGSSGTLRDKESSRRFFETWRLAPTLRLGYGNFSIYGAYQITEVFKPNNPQAEGVRPISIGLCISGM
jgi:hypothetical protein